MNLARTQDKAHCLLLLNFWMPGYLALTLGIRTFLK